MSVSALQAQLRALGSIVEDLPDEVFTAKSGRASGSIGEHVRHALDHARALLSLRDGEELTYDARLRGTPVESSTSAAGDAIRRTCRDLDALNDGPLDRPIRLYLIEEPGRSPSEMTSTVGREIAFVVQHTIHHCALIGLLLERRGVSTPARFGYAPSTPARS